MTRSMHERSIRGEPDRRLDPLADDPVDLSALAQSCVQ